MCKCVFVPELATSFDHMTSVMPGCTSACSDSVSVQTTMPKIDSYFLVSTTFDEFQLRLAILIIKLQDAFFMNLFSKLRHAK